MREIIVVRRHSFLSPVSTSSSDLAKLLIDSEAEVFYFATSWRTPFIAALASGNFAIAVLIIWKVFFSITLLLFIYSFSVTRNESGRERYQSSMKLFAKIISPLLVITFGIITTLIFESRCFCLQARLYSIDKLNKYFIRRHDMT